MGKKYKSLDELVEYANKAIGLSFKEIDKNNRLQTKGNKGNLGQIVEEGFFGYKINNKQEADFINLGVELKVTPYKWVKKNKLISAKERLVLTHINYMTDFDTDFKDSNCYHKLEKILMMFYEHETDKQKYDYIISKIFLYQYNLLSLKDQQIILNDYNTIINKIQRGEAHTISESDTFYLSACTKGQTANASLTEQPFNTEKAKSRAFALKTSYMTNLLRNKIFLEADNRESFIKEFSKLNNKSLGTLITDTFIPFKNKTLTEIDKIIENKINRISSKQYLRSYISAMLNVSEQNLNNIEEFSKANIKIKTIRVNKNGKIRESISFPAFKIKKLLKENWSDSSLRNQFLTEKYLFCIFDEINDSDKEYRFRKAFLWNMPESDIDSKLKNDWLSVIDVFNSGLSLKKKQIKGGKIIIENNLPSKNMTNIVHVRPHTSKRIYRFKNGSILGDGNLKTDGDELPDGRIITKQCFFLNNKYMLKIIEMEGQE